MVQVKMKKKDATVYCNLLRHAALYNRRVVRPVAFRVNNACNLLSAGGSVQEDMITFANSLTGINYAYKTDEELMVATVEPVDTLSYKDLCQNGILLANQDDDRIILHSINQPLTATVYFRNSSGCFRESENADFLNGHGVSVEDQRIVVLNSRHTDVESFCWDVVESITDEVTVNFEIQSFLNCSEASILNDAIRQVHACLDELVVPKK